MLKGIDEGLHFAFLWLILLRLVISIELLGYWVVTHIPTLSSIYTLYLLLC